MATSDAPANAHLVIVGDGPVRADLEAQAQKLGLADRVTFTGVIHRDQVPDWVAQGAYNTIAKLDLTWAGNARKVVALAEKLHKPV